jgi:hypothetical protein
MFPVPATKATFCPSLLGETCLANKQGKVSREAWSKMKGGLVVRKKFGYNGRKPGDSEALQALVGFGEKKSSWLVSMIVHIFSINTEESQFL